MSVEKHLQREIQTLLSKAEWWLSAEKKDLTIAPFNSSLKYVRGEDDEYVLAELEDSQSVLDLKEWGAFFGAAGEESVAWKILGQSQAIACYRKVLEIDPSCVFALVRIGLLHLELASDDESLISEAAEFLAQAAEASPSDPVPYLLLAYAIEKLDEASEEVGEYCRIAWGIDPFLFIAPPELCQQGGIGCYTFDDTYSAFISRHQLLDVYDAVRMGFPDWGLIELNKIELKTIDPFTQGELLKSVLGWLEEWDTLMKTVGLQDHYFALQKETPGYQMLLLRYASWLDAVNNLDGARKYYDEFHGSLSYKWVGEVTEYWQAQLWLKLFEPMVNFYIGQRLLDKADQICAEICHRKPTEIRAWLKYIELVWEMKDYDKTIQICHNGLFNNPDSLELHSRLISLLVDLSRDDPSKIEEAKRVLESGRKALPSNAEFLSEYWYYYPGYTDKKTQ